MEDILTYVIIFGLLIIFTLVFLSNKEKKKEFILTNNIYSFGSLKVLIEKQGKEVKYLILKHKLHEDLPTDNVSLSVETISTDKSVLKIEIPKQLVHALTPGENKIDYNGLYKLISTGSIQLQQFRIVVTLAENKKLKSGLLAFNKKWNIYTPDAGTYN